MNKVVLKPRQPYHISRAKLADEIIDIGGRDILVGFNEPEAKVQRNGDLVYSSLNARLPAYFLPAVDIAGQQESRPQFYILSGINVSLRWNPRSDEQRRIMLAHNKMKFDFLKLFFEKFYPDTFSIVELVVAQDPLMVSEEKILEIWRRIEEIDSVHAKELKDVFLRFKNIDSEKGSQKKSALELNVLKYAVAHLFAFGDVNFEGSYYINPNGFASIGGIHEQYFNEVRNLAFKCIHGIAKEFFSQDVILRDNVQVVIEKEIETPPPYSGSTKGNKRKIVLDEVTYENNLDIDYYDTRDRLKPDMDYLYAHIQKETYQEFWDSYKPRYLDMKSRYEEAYRVKL